MTEVAARTFAIEAVATLGNDASTAGSKTRRRLQRHRAAFHSWPANHRAARPNRANMQPMSDAIADVAVIETRGGRGTAAPARCVD